MLPPLAQDPRLDSAIDLFNRGEFEEASDLAEDLFFEAVGAERPVARVLLQLFVGMVHVDQRQSGPALERIGVGLDEARAVGDWMGIDGCSLVRDMEAAVRQIAAGETVSKILVVRRPARSEPA